MSFQFELGAPWTWLGIGLTLGTFPVILFSIKRDPLGLYVILCGYIVCAPKRMQMPTIENKPKDGGNDGSGD